MSSQINISLLSRVSWKHNHVIVSRKISIILVMIFFANILTISAHVEAKTCDNAQLTSCIADIKCPSGVHGQACAQYIKLERSACTMEFGCAVGEGCCAGTCSKLSTDRHCGSCNVSCLPNQHCCKEHCIDYATDAKNCGRCGQACSFLNAIPACQNSTCVLSSCTAGWGNCDGNIANGCETNITNNVSHCGTCGTVCTAPANATPTCSNGVCGFVCVSGHADCNHNAADGCETNIKTSIANCGSCGHACSSNNGMPSCNGGVCSISCNPNYADCNHNAADGCETNTQTSIANCGSCGHACSSNNGIPSCNGGVCSISCNPGFGNCDGDASNGCETNILTSVSNCGACGNHCASGMSCVNGKCACSLPGQKYCNGICTNVDSDVNNCGECGKKCNNIMCYKGSCQCPDPGTMRWCKEVNTCVTLKPFKSSCTYNCECDSFICDAINKTCY